MKIHEYNQMMAYLTRPATRTKLAEGSKLQDLGNIVDVRNIPYYANKATEGVVNAAESLAKLPLAAGELGSQLLTQKPNKKMFTDALENITPGSWADAIGLSELTTRQEEGMSPAVKTAGSQIGLTGEMFVPVGGAFGLGNKIIKNASSKIGPFKKDKNLEQVIDETLTARGEGRRDFNKVVATGGLLVALKSLGLGGITKVSKMVDDIKVKLRGNLDADFDGESYVDASTYETFLEPLTLKGKKILQDLVKKKELAEDFAIMNSEDAAGIIEKIKPNANMHLDLLVKGPEKGKKLAEGIVENKEIIGGGDNPAIFKEYSKIYKKGDKKPSATELDNLGNPDLTTDPVYADSVYSDEFHEEIMDMILQSKNKKWLKVKRVVHHLNQDQHHKGWILTTILLRQWNWRK